MPSSNKATRSTRSTRSTSQTSGAINGDTNVTPKKATRKLGGARTAGSSTRPIPQTSVSSSIAARPGSSTPRGLVHSPEVRAKIEGGTIPEESSSQPFYSMEDSIEGSSMREPTEKALGEMLSVSESGYSLTKSQKKAYETFEGGFSFLFCHPTRFVSLTLPFVDATL